MWKTIAAERGALAADLANVADPAWETPSLCEGWTVRDVLAHMTSTATMTPPKFLAGFAGSGSTSTSSPGRASRHTAAASRRRPW